MDLADQLAAPTPTPGGGAAAARAGLYGVSLLRMVAAITLEKIGAEDRGGREKVERIAAAAAALASDFRHHEAEDIRAFEGFISALRLPRRTDEEKAQRRTARLRAAEEATEVPLRVLASSLQVLDLVRELLGLGAEVRLRAESDLGGAVELAHAAFRAAEWNVRVNIPLLGSSAELAGFTGRWEDLRERMAAEYLAVRRLVLEQLGSTA